jgi:hypothetical protein
MVHVKVLSSLETRLEAGVGDNGGLDTVTSDGLHQGALSLRQQLCQ